MRQDLPIFLFKEQFYGEKSKHMMELSVSHTISLKTLPTIQVHTILNNATNRLVGFSHTFF